VEAQTAVRRDGWRWRGRLLRDTSPISAFPRSLDELTTKGGQNRVDKTEESVGSKAEER